MLNQGIPENEGQSDDDIQGSKIVGSLQWFLATVVILGIAYLIYILAQRFFSLIGGAMIAIISIICGYLGVLWFFLNLPGSFIRSGVSDLLYFLFSVAIICLIGAGLGVVSQIKKLSRSEGSSDKKTE